MSAPTFLRNHKHCFLAMPLYRTLLIVHFFVALAVVVGECQTEDDAAFIQLASSFSIDDLLDDCQNYRAPTWASKRDLANVSLSPLIDLDSNFSLRFWSAVPYFGSTSYVALLASIHKAREPHKSFDPEELRSSLQKNALFCTGPNRSHRRELRVASLKDIAILLCDWPREEADFGMYKLYLEDAKGRAMGEVEANYKPSLLKQYGTVACVQNLWNNPRLNVSGLRLFPQWLDFHNSHGINHFIVYTTSDMSPVWWELYQPYIDEGLVTRVHLNLAKDRRRSFSEWLQSFIWNDCLYRAKGHAKWLIPSLAVDEYLRLRLTDHSLTEILDAASGPSEASVTGVAFKKYRFARAPPAQMEISSPLYFNWPERSWKHAVKVDLVKAVSDLGNGTFYDSKEQFGVVNHYRHPSPQEIKNRRLANSTDEFLLKEVPILETALEKRYGKEWRSFLEKVQHEEVPCGDHSAQLRSEKIIEPLELTQIN